MNVLGNSEAIRNGGILTEDQITEKLTKIGLNPENPKHRTFLLRLNADYPEDFITNVFAILEKVMSGEKMTAEEAVDLIHVAKLRDFSMLLGLDLSALDFSQVERVATDREVDFRNLQVGGLLDLSGSKFDGLRLDKVAVGGLSDNETIATNLTAEGMTVAGTPIDPEELKQRYLANRDSKFQEVVIAHLTEQSARRVARTAQLAREAAEAQAANSTLATPGIGWVALSASGCTSSPRGTVPLPRPLEERIFSNSRERFFAKYEFTPNEWDWIIEEDGTDYPSAEETIKDPLSPTYVNPDKEKIRKGRFESPSYPEDEDD